MGDELNLGQIRESIVGSEDKARNVQVDKKAGEQETATAYKSGKMVLRYEDNLNESIQLDYNPTTIPFNKVAKYSDKDVIGGTDDIAFQSKEMNEFELDIFLNDFGYHTKKGMKETAQWKRDWLLNAMNPGFREVDGQLVNTPPILFLSRGFSAMRVVILEIHGTEEMLDKYFTPIRMSVRIKFREIKRRKQKAQGVK